MMKFSTFAAFSGLPVMSDYNLYFSGIHVTYKGKGYVIWTESRGKSSRTFVAKQHYFMEEGTVWKGEGNYSLRKREMVKSD